ncbi:hypothetical protein [Streptomyces sp. NPDC056244]|uniref:hypothetical protein n=1 Tax=unclassified Streptomyces TaxID=2593676 RepID=UPI0035D5B865
MNSSTAVNATEPAAEITGGRVTDKVWFITGVSTGLGLEMTRQLLARGTRVTR